MSDSSQKTFDLDISGVAGFFGGDVSVSAMATVHVYEGRKWLGWYNQPGSYEIAKRYGQLSRSRFWDALYPGVNVDPAVLFEFDGTEGPKFTASQSGTVLPKTGHVARLFAEECKDLPIDVPVPRNDPAVRVSTPGCVTIANLRHEPLPEETPRQDRDLTSILASVPILTSVGACVGCAIIRDWYCFASILLGIFSSGLSCFVIGMGVLKFSHPPPANGAPDGDGVLESDGTNLIIMKGKEAAVNAVTRGQFTLDYASKPEYRNIGICSTLLTLQFVAQLLLIPQSTLHGQLFFLATLACSWAYNSYLSSLDRENIQRAIVRDQVLRIKPGQLEKYELGTRTAMVTFALLLLAPADGDALRRVLNDLLPNNTDVWKLWKEEVLQNIDVGFREGAPQGFTFTFSDPPSDLSWVQDRKKLDLLAILRGDARAASAMYAIYRLGRGRVSTSLSGEASVSASTHSTWPRPSQKAPLGSVSYSLVSAADSTEALAYGPKPVQY
ncbi:hypothetical protein C8Q77DRAFT_1155133 [Trametes polyzona]|nr:hypothetical protein C8Q77DRAFT_1155133 [Trametes polyzona]